jgi:hypothetical protein
MRTRLPALGLIVAMSLIAGCGSGSSKTASSGSTATSASSNGGESTAAASGGALSLSQLGTRADEICLRLNNELETKRVGSVSPQSVVQITTRRIPIEQAALVELSRLKPPASVAADWQKFLAIRRTLIEELEKLKRYAQAKNAAGEKAVFVSSSTFETKMNAPSERVNAKVCARVI